MRISDWSSDVCSSDLIPDSDKVLCRIAAKADERSGWGTNQFTGNDLDDNNERAVRAKLQFQLSDRFQIKLTADYSRADDAQVPHFAGTEPNNAPPLGVPLLGGTVPDRTSTRLNYSTYCASHILS